MIFLLHYRNFYKGFFLMIYEDNNFHYFIVCTVNNVVSSNVVLSNYLIYLQSYNQDVFNVIL